MSASYAQVVFDKMAASLHRLEGRTGSFLDTLKLIDAYVAVRVESALAAERGAVRDRAGRSPASSTQEQPDDDNTGDRGHDGEQGGDGLHDGAERQRVGDGGGSGGAVQAGAGHVADAGADAGSRDGVTPDFRRLSVAMAYDSGVEAGRSAERARVVGLVADALNAELKWADASGNTRGVDALGGVFNALHTAAPSGTTTEAP